VDLTKGNGLGFKVEDVGPTHSNTIITHDAERTFIGNARRKILVRLLSCYENRFKDYHQGLALVSGFLLMTLKEQEVADIVTALATNPMYIPDYWCAEAIAGARDAYVWEYLVQQHDPEVAAHLRKRLVFPETFCQKWFIALTIGVLPFQALYRFFELFLQQGYLYLFRFGLSLVTTYRTQLLASQDFEIFHLLRYAKELHKKWEITDDTMYDVVERAGNFQLVSFDIKTVREKVFKEKLEARLARAKGVQIKAEEDSSEDLGTSNESDDEEGGGAECAVCEKNAPDMWCLVCLKMLCEKCHSSSAGGHKQKVHKVDEEWTKYEKTGNDE